MLRVSNVTNHKYRKTFRNKRILLALIMRKANAKKGGSNFVINTLGMIWLHQPCAELLPHPRAPANRCSPTRKYMPPTAAAAAANGGERRRTCAVRRACLSCFGTGISLLAPLLAPASAVRCVCVCARTCVSCHRGPTTTTTTTHVCAVRLPPTTPRHNASHRVVRYLATASSITCALSRGCDYSEHITRPTPPWQPPPLTIYR